MLLQLSLGTNEGKSMDDDAHNEYDTQVLLRFYNMLCEQDIIIRAMKVMLEEQTLIIENLRGHIRMIDTTENHKWEP